jgi:hypothetical protein
MTSKRYIGLTTATVVLLLAASGTALVDREPRKVAPRATTVVCGQSIHTSIVVANDLDCDQGALGVNAALRIEADGVTVDMNGHQFMSVGATQMEFGIVIEAVDDVTVIGPGRLRRFGTGVFIAGNRIRIEGLRVHGGTYGIRGVSDQPGLSNVAIRNNVVESNSNSGIDFSCCGLPSKPNNSFIGNRLLNNGGNGLSDAFAGSVIRGNIANGNAYDGIRTSESRYPSTVTGNTADYNGRWGITAGGGVIDGGNNRAEGNVQREQCENVVCS